ncbi:hypothetical protein C0J52_22679, partial [Blattella germanica]
KNSFSSHISIFLLRFLTSWSFNNYINNFLIITQHIIYDIRVHSWSRSAILKSSRLLCLNLQFNPQRSASDVNLQIN